MRGYIDLERRFRDLTEEERENPAVIALLGLTSYPGGIDWKELLDSDRVVILAEAGCGKTWEMQAQAERLQHEGLPAFFIPIEALDKEKVEDYLALQPGEAQLFKDWTVTDGTIAWFFLDAVDELKLTGGKLDKALARMAQAIGPRLPRARILISCRPSDWRPVQDLELFEKRLPAVSSPPLDVEFDSDASFLAPIRAQFASSSAPQATDSRRVISRCVFLLPLAEAQITRFAESKGVTKVQALLSEIRRREAWVFARRPLDLERLVQVWQSKGVIGTLREQHEADVAASLVDSPDRSQITPISYSRALEGAECLALAMMFTRHRTIKSLEQGEGTADPSSIDARTVLTRWLPAEVDALLRLPMFDPATYGRVRFHHRSIQEYLAASRLAKLRKAGLTARQLHRVLFAETYGARVTIPSLRPIAAWLAADEDSVRRTLMEREPEVLVIHGDPEALPFPVVEELIRCYVEAYKHGGWRGLQMPLAEIRRLARSDLGMVIRECWGQRGTNEEVCEFLLKLIWAGAIDDCSDLTASALIDPNLSAYSRIVAARALKECARNQELRAGADHLMAYPDQWPGKTIFGIVELLIPDILTVDELETLIIRTGEPRRAYDGFSRAMYEAVDSLSLDGDFSSRLVTMLSRLIWDGREDGPSWDRMKSRFHYLCPALAKLCHRLVEAGRVDAAIIRAAVLTKRYHRDAALGTTEIRTLAKAIEATNAAREEIFWTEYEILSEGTNDFVSRPGQECHYRLFHQGLLTRHRTEDRDWLLAYIGQENPKHRRQIVLAALLNIWVERGLDADELAELKDLVSDQHDLVEHILWHTRPTEQSVEAVQWEAEQKAHLQEAEQERIATEASWLDWKRQAVADPSRFFSAEKAEESMWTLINWLRTGADAGSAIALSHWREIRKILGDAVADGFETAIRNYWRTELPLTDSARSAEQQNSIFYSQYAGLTGLLVENARGSWTALSQSEAVRAARWSVTDLNRFPEWLEALAKAKPQAVLDTLTAELAFEIDSRRIRPHTLSAVRTGPERVKKLVAPYLAKRLEDWPSDCNDSERDSATVRHLEMTIEILAAAGAIDGELPERFERHLMQDSEGARAICWLQGIFAYSLTKGMTAIERALEATPVGNRALRAIEWLGAIFSDHGSRTIPIRFDADAASLAEMVRLSYRYIRQEDDVEREGVYSIGVREHAESARNKLLTSLINAEGHAAYLALLALSEDPLFAHMSDRLRKFARERSAADSEKAAWSSEEYLSWESARECTPKNRDELFQVVLDRLEDIEHEILHDDFSDRENLKRIDQERDMQPLIAKRFKGVSRSQYHVAREEEVADKKLTDIRLFSRGSSDRCVVELKLGDNYSVRQLEETLSMQIVAQYLRHKDCTAGCLLITYAGRKEFQAPQTRKKLAFSDVVRHLQAFAADLELKEAGRIRLAVFGLDLRPPLKR